MKILLLHNYYQQAGGEDGVLVAEAKLLARHGHSVQLCCVDNKDLPGGLSGKINTALSTRYSSFGKALVTQAIRAFGPDLVHVHNFFPQFSPSIYDACRETGIPVLQTLHNYRLICPGALLMRDGQICELCLQGSPFQAVRYGCYRGSKLGSLVVADMVAWHRRHGTWHDKVDRFIALTEFAKAKFVEAGFPAEKISVKANFVAVNQAGQSRSADFALFVGRLSAEKGVATLAEAWSQLSARMPLRVAGSGDLASLLQGQAGVDGLGQQKPEQIAQLMQQAAFLVMPSQWYEGFPMVLLEALAHGLPILASRLGGMAEIVRDGETGLLFEAGNPQDLADKAAWLIDHPEQRLRMGENARADYLAHYTSEQNYQQLLAIYRSLLPA